MKATLLSFFTFFTLPGFLLAELPLGSLPPPVVLSGDKGGLVRDGSSWDSRSLTGKVSVIFYVDPDERDLNEKASAALAADDALDESRKVGKFASYVILNMAATWLPNVVLTRLIEDSQRNFPTPTTSLIWQRCSINNGILPPTTAISL